MSTPNKPGKGPMTAQGRKVALWRLTLTWIQTLLGVALMGGLTAGALLYFGLHWSWAVAVLSFTMFMPLIGWYFSASFVKRMTGCKLADPRNPQHLRLIKIVDRLYPKTGLPRKPEVFISPMKLPNAFATGRTPSDAFIAATEGLFLVGLTDDEMEAVLAHELAHVRNYDVAINSMLAVMGSLFAIVLSAAFPRLFHPSFATGAPLLDKLSSKVRTQRKRFFVPVGGVLGLIVMLTVFYIVGACTKFVTLFVARTRESAADAQAALWTGKPCALSMALQKITYFMMTHVIDMRHNIISRGLAPLLFIADFDDEPAPRRSKLSRWWRSLGENHPPVTERMRVLDEMSGSSCPRII